MMPFYGPSLIVILLTCCWSCNLPLFWLIALNNYWSLFTIATFWLNHPQKTRPTEDQMIWCETNNCGCIKQISQHSKCGRLNMYLAQKSSQCVLVIVCMPPSHTNRWTRWTSERVCNKKQRLTVMDCWVSVRLWRAEVLLTSNWV